MSQYFNLTRFGRIFRKHLTENTMRYLLSTAVLLGGILLVMGFICYLQRSAPGPTGQIVFCILFLMGAGSFFTSSVLAQFGVGRRAALALTLPASQLEKYLVAWLVSLPMFLVVYLAVFYAADWLVLQIMHTPGAALVNIFTQDAVPALLIYLVLHGLALWGSIFYSRQQFVKTAFVSFVLAAGLGVLNLQSMKLLINKDVRRALPWGDVHFNNATLSLPEAQQQWFLLVPMLLALLLWAAAYARLTEKQL